MSLIFDTHAHYDDEAFDVDRETLLASMPEHGVGRILDPGCDLESSRRAVELARTYPHVYAAVGWHPENCAPYTAESLDTLRAIGQGNRRSSLSVRSGWTTTGSRTRRGSWQQRVLSRSARAGAGAGPPRHRARPRGARRQSCHRAGISRCARCVPLLLRQRRDGARASKARLVSRL